MSRSDIFVHRYLLYFAGSKVPVITRIQKTKEMHENLIFVHGVFENLTFQVKVGSGYVLPKSLGLDPFSIPADQTLLNQTLSRKV